MRRRLSLRPAEAVRQYGGAVLASPGMALERGFLQHGRVSVFEHSVQAAYVCAAWARALQVPVDGRSLVRGALLHDYFLYDWHEKDAGHRLHGLHHARRALKNARKQYRLSPIEANMIDSHMFPLNLRLPRCRESVLLCLADKYCALRETLRLPCCAGARPLMRQPAPAEDMPK